MLALLGAPGVVLKCILLILKSSPYASVYVCNRRASFAGIKRDNRLRAA